MTKPNWRTGPRTTAIHAGEAPDPVTGASAPNLVMSTTYVLEAPLGFSAHDLGDESPFIYTRWGNPTVRQLEDKLAALEGAEAGLCFASGMAASAAVLLGGLSAGDHLVVSDTNYAGTAELARQTLPRLGIAVTPVDSSNLAAVEAALRPETRLIWIETPANPILRLSDIAALAALSSPSIPPSPRRSAPVRSIWAPTSSSTRSPSTSAATATPWAARCSAPRRTSTRCTWRRRSTTAAP
jgi:methionine-gamma-lyase